MAKEKKYLVDTSAIRPAIGYSTKEHCQHFREQVGAGKLFTSVYIRMEFIRVWFCEVCHLAFTIAHYRDVSDALIYLEQDFSQRKNKALIASFASFLRQVGPLTNGDSAAEEWAAQALRWLAHFDSVFHSRINNLCKCQLGQREPNVDYNSLLHDLREFYLAFKTPVQDCEVNKFLQLRQTNGKAVRLVAEPNVAKLTAAVNLQTIANKGETVDCNNCAKIGDVVIALEQPGSWNLAHVDKSFNTLCDALGKPHTHMKSVRGIAKDLTAQLTPKDSDKEPDKEE